MRNISSSFIRDQTPEWFELKQNVWKVRPTYHLRYLLRSWGIIFSEKEKIQPWSWHIGTSNGMQDILDFEILLKIKWLTKDNKNVLYNCKNTNL